MKTIAIITTIILLGITLYCEIVKEKKRQKEKERTRRILKQVFKERKEDYYAE